MLSGCVSTGVGRPLNPAEVTTAPGQWEAQTIRVSGTLAFGSHARCLCQEARGGDDFGNCLTLVNTFPFRARLVRLHGQAVTVSGVVIPDTSKDAHGSDILDFGSCGQVGLLVETVE